MVDLNTCEEGDTLISKHGTKLTYVRKLNPEIDYYDHEVKYENGSRGTRVNSGHVMKNAGRRLETDEDIEGVVRYNFGRDKDKSVKENKGFGQWMLDQNFSKDTKNKLKEIINKL